MEFNSFSLVINLLLTLLTSHSYSSKDLGSTGTISICVITLSKDLVNLFNKAGHCLCYEQILQVDTSLAENTLKTLDQATGATIPSNMMANKFIHYTCDNIDILDETLDGKNTFHATQLAAW